MNKRLQTFARHALKDGLAQLPESHHMLFKHMYSYTNLDADINDVVDAMPEGKLDRAMQQVQQTLDKM